MTIRTFACAAASLLSAATLLAPAWAAAQGIAASGELGTRPGGLGVLAGNAMNSGVGNPDGFPETTPKVTGLPPAGYNPEIEYARGYADFGYGAYIRAEEEFGHVLKVDPRNIKALFMLGVTYNMTGERDRAMSTFQRALKIDPGQIDSRREYAVALARAGQHDKAQAQFSILQSQAASCASACAQAENYKASLERVQAALAEPPKS